VKIEGRRWHFEAVDDLTVAERGEAAHEVSLAMIDPPRSRDELKRVAVRTALMNLCEGTVSHRAKQLEQKYRAYLRAGWKREKGLDQLPDPRSVERTLLHRLAKLGCASSWSQLLRYAGQDFRL
jgi:hypothetical protein